MMLVECGAIRERVSQELARTVFDAVKRELERDGSIRIGIRIARIPIREFNYHSVSGTPPR